MRKAVRPNRVFEDYIIRHHESWYTLANDRKLHIRREDILLVSGWIKTSAWAVAALVGEGQSHAFSLGAEGLSVAQAHFEVERSAEVEMSVLQRSGPLVLSNPERRDQCLFINYYKMKYRLPFLRQIVAGAGPDEREAYGEDWETLAGAFILISALFDCLCTLHAHSTC